MPRKTAEHPKTSLWERTKGLKAREFFSHEFLELTTVSDTKERYIREGVKLATETDADMSVEDFTTKFISLTPEGTLSVKNVPRIGKDSSRAILKLLALVGFSHPDLPPKLSPDAAALLATLKETNSTT